VSFSLLSRTRTGSGKPLASYFRPHVEGLEDRVTPATMNLPLAVDSLKLVDTATGPAVQAVVSLAGQATDTVTATLSTEAGQVGILHLELGPINLQLLGLHVDTSQICLDVSATPGGGLLGDLLGGLGGGPNLGGILSGLGGQINDLLGRLDNVLDTALGGALTVDHIFGHAGEDSVCTGECEILDLSLGPVDLSLLGLNVSLDDCDDGPVQVCVSATAGEGLLGDLLCGLSDGGVIGGGLGGLIGRLDNLVDQLGDLADQLGNLPNTGQLVKRVEKTIDKVEKLIDKLDRLDDRPSTAKVAKQVEKVIDRVEKDLSRVINQLIGQLT